MDSNALALKNLEKLLTAQGYLYCQRSGRRITEPDDLAMAHVDTPQGRLLALPVHTDHTKELLQILINTFSQGINPLEDADD